MTDQIDKLIESLNNERGRNDLLRENNLKLKVENFTLKQRQLLPSLLPSLGTEAEKSRNEIIEIRTELINKAEHQRKHQKRREY